MKVLSLFAGIGGFDLGFELAGWTTVATVEIDKYCNKILKEHFPNARQYTDICTVTGAQILRDCGPVEVICGGFPCQDISVAGHGAGLDGKRSGLWSEYRRLVSELRPRWVVIENVDALRARGLDRVVANLEELAYKVWCFGIPASACGATHRRKRIVILGYSAKLPKRKSAKKTNTLPTDRQARNELKHTGAYVANANSDKIWEQHGRCCREERPYSPFTFPVGPAEHQFDWECSRTVESKVGFTADGLPLELALRACGNAFVPAIPFVIARAIERVEKIVTT